MLQSYYYRFEDLNNIVIEKFRNAKKKLNVKKDIEHRNNIYVRLSTLFTEELLRLMFLLTTWK